jgi:hypothetical protein
MRSSAVQRAFEQADVVAGSQDAILGFGGASLAPRNAHPLPVDRMTRNGFVDDSRAFAQDSGHQREINLRHRPRGELPGKIAMGRVVFRHDEAAARFLVESMDNSGPFLPADAG